ncbi:MAG TPA: hypothetical protein VMV72_13550 [Verrucomicrobiae bacterium]|nr:hypothetical protein [Verrucomicrobiae bacterium]
MRSRSKRDDPIDRAINDLDHQIAAVQRQLRELSAGPAVNGGSDPATGGAGWSSPSPARKLTRFVKSVLSPSADKTATAERARQDLFDGGAEPLKELEAEPIAFAHKPEPDLFAAASAEATNTRPFTTTLDSSGLGVGTPPANSALESAQVVPPKDKLAHYLGAGSIKSYKPLRHAQRQARNRFFMWLGLSFVALWIIWFVIR